MLLLSFSLLSNASALIAGAPPAASLQATTEVFSLRSKAPRAKVFALGDRQTLFLWLRRAPANLDSQLAVQKRPSLVLRATPLPKDAAQIRIRTRGLLVNHELDTNGSNLHLTLTHAQPEALLLQRLTRIPPPRVPSRFTHAAFETAETLIAQHEFPRARRALGQLRSKAELAPYAHLRLNDLHLLQGDDETACSGYSQILKDHPTRPAGLLARQRLLSATCPNRPDVNWQAYFAWTLRLESRLGDYLFSEGLWRLGLATRPEALANAVDVLEALDGLPAALAQKVRVTRRQLWYRSLSHANAYKAVSARLRLGRELQQLPAAKTLSLLAAEHWARLDILQPAIKELLRARSMKRGGAAGFAKRGGKAQLVRRLVRYAELAHRPTLRQRLMRKHGELLPSPTQTSSSHARRSPFSERIRELERRIKRARRYIRTH